MISYNTSEIQRKFIQQLCLEDEKIIKVLEYQQKYNEFMDKNNDMIMEEYTKEEMHMRVGDLEQNLWEMSVGKKELLSAQRV